MTETVPADQIETIVGLPRHLWNHLGRAVSSEQRVYILHSAGCLAYTPDLTKCPWSIALDRGIDPDRWPEDVPVLLVIGLGGELLARCPEHGIPDCSPLLNGCTRLTQKDNR